MRFGYILPVIVLLSLGPGLGVGNASGAAFHGGGTLDTNAVSRMQQSLREAMALAKFGSNILKIGSVQLNRSERRITVPARVRLTNQVVEYALVTDYGKGYESLFTTTARAEDIHVACLLLGLSPSPMSAENDAEHTVGKTNGLRIEVSWTVKGATKRVPLCSLIQLTSGHPDPKAPALKRRTWLYNGSVQDRSGFAASNEGSIISLINDPVALINNPRPDRDRDECHFPFEKKLPPAGTDVLVILKPL